MPNIDAKKIEELLPCPFCGGVAQAEHFESKLGRWRWSIGCNDHTSKADDGGEPAAECYGFQSMTSFATKAEAIAAWNRRATASEAQAAALRERVWVLEKALEPFAEAATKGEIGGYPPNYFVGATEFENARRARTALEGRDNG